ncbi:nicotinate (nicotinamide) nucleotide adenylyltransferase [Candidatus Gottesmanbacteria bacterium]|nr:nicotinate (nicotinamide) nucleotide adenylyltransferase [Candidatus Gottesmanbacteria bacterium]
MHIAIIGGRFDPPHIWHFWTAQQVLENVKDIDEVWLMPDYANALKPIIASPDDRLEMLKYLETGRIKISTVGLSRASVTYTVEVVKELKQRIENTYYWIIGSDALAEFSRWREYQKLSSMVKFLVFPRKDYPIRILPPGFKKVEDNLLLSNISSSIVRERLKNGLTIDGLVFPEVRQYIKKNNLYK